MPPLTLLTSLFCPGAAGMYPPEKQEHEGPQVVVDSDLELNNAYTEYPGSRARQQAICLQTAPEAAL
jgi:hypothetical protein